MFIAAGLPALSSAEPVTMSIMPNGQGGFLMKAENVAGVQALDIDIDYDSVMLANPNVMTHGGDITRIKDDVPGKLFLSIFRPDADPLLQIDVYFEEVRTANTANGISHVSAIVRSTTPWPGPDADPPGPVDEPTDAPADVPSPARKEKNVPAAVVPKKGPAAAPATDAAPAALPVALSPANADRQVQAAKITLLAREEKSVLQRFKKYQGEKDLSSFVALFGRSGGERVRQEPAIAISDGKTPVTIRIDAQPDGEHPTALALSDAALLSKEAHEKEIVVAVLPSKGTWESRLVTVAGGEILDYPLVVVPRVAINAGMKEKDFLAALNAYIADQALTRRGVNKSYVYWYIFTANYLAAEANASVKTVSR